MTDDLATFGFVFLVVAALVAMLLSLAALCALAVGDDPFWWAKMWLEFWHAVRKALAP